MDNKELELKAEEYLGLEENEYFRNEMQQVLDKKDWENLNDRFYTELSFGTGGLRGVIGGGYNRMNAFTVRKATQGLADYINRAVENGSVVIAYDSRNFSDVFAKEAALTLCANGIKTSVFSSLRPTPELSYAVRELNATAGIVVTASHNPPEYNGYKVYWSDGCQVTPPHDTGIIDMVRAVEKPKASLPENEALESGMLKYIDSEIDDKYVNMVKSYFFNAELVKEKGGELNVVYTPLHGTGTMLVERILGECGIEVNTVPEQREPDGDFPTVDYPNPEEASAMKLALELGEKTRADLVLGTDPDADRLGIAVPGEDGKFRLVTGNQLGCLLGDYIFSVLKSNGKMPPNPRLVKTIVTTDLQKLIAESYGVETYDVLTGFKYIGEKIKEFETSGESYVFGGEESYGYLLETEVRDKDAVSAAVITAEMALYDRSRGMSLLDHLNDIYERFGFFKEIQIAKTFKGQAGVEKIKGLMNSLRENNPEKLGGSPVMIVKDYKLRVESDKTNGSEKKIELPESNVLQFILEDGTIVTARPSGTEPKIKFYASCRADKGLALKDAEAEVEAKLEKLSNDIESLCK
ncbi:MAG: phospho-sugar mutase [Spirochaetales bacterium]|uniref:Phospho-sugar mutase n=1 Tax=Candidatus Thalassospirochaeta sargassi TaxID=3119039 RepID=A0AAJ1IGJ5_9SPIO|nr:phospho-sugar mutase [Spirochaetales bacterium]